MSKLFPTDGNKDSVAGGRLRPASQDAGLREFYRDVMHDTGSPSTVVNRHPGDIKPVIPRAQE